MLAAPGIAVTVKTRSEASAGSNTSILRSVASASGLAKTATPATSPVSRFGTMRACFT